MSFFSLIPPSKQAISGENGPTQGFIPEMSMPPCIAIVSVADMRDVSKDIRLILQTVFGESRRSTKARWVEEEYGCSQPQDD